MMATAEQTVSAVLANLGTDNIIEVDDRLDTEGWRIERLASGLMKIFARTIASGNNDANKEMVFPQGFSEIPILFLQRVTSYQTTAQTQWILPKEVTETGFTYGSTTAGNSTYAYLAIGRAQ